MTLHRFVIARTEVIKLGDTKQLDPSPSSVTGQWPIRLRLMGYWPVARKGYGFIIVKYKFQISVVAHGRTVIRRSHGNTPKKRELHRIFSRIPKPHVYGGPLFEN